MIRALINCHEIREVSRHSFVGGYEHDFCICGVVVRECLPSRLIVAPAVSDRFPLQRDVVRWLLRHVFVVFDVPRYGNSDFVFQTS